MDVLAQDYPRTLLAAREAPCLSLYQPTHRHFPDRQQDPIRFRNLVRTLEQSLHNSYPSRDVASLLAPFQRLAEDADFWNDPLDGLAVLGATDFFRVYRLQRTVPELAIVADTFHTKPLLRIVQSADRYQVLALDRHEAWLLEGNRDGLDEVPLAPGVPGSIDEAFDRDIERERSTRVVGRVGSRSAVRHGTDVRQDSIDADTEAFFRAVDRAVLEHHSRPSGLPLLLAALPENQGRFRAISQNPQLVAEGIEANPSALSLEQMRERAWQLVLPRYHERLTSLVDAFGAANASGRGSDQLGDVARAAVAGRVSTVLLEADRQIPGKMDPQGGSIVFGALEGPKVDDLLDDIGEKVIENGGEVVLVPADRMPTTTGVAAIFRF